MKAYLKTFPNQLIFNICFNEKVNEDVIDFINNLKGVMDVSYETDLFIRKKVKTVTNKFNLKITIANNFFKSNDIFDAVINRFCK